GPRAPAGATTARAAAKGGNARKPGRAGRTSQVDGGRGSGLESARVRLALTALLSPEHYRADVPDGPGIFLRRGGSPWRAGGIRGAQARQALCRLCARVPI